MHYDFDEAFFRIMSLSISELFYLFRGEEFEVMTKAIDRVWGFINEERPEKIKEAFHSLKRFSRSPN